MPLDINTLKTKFGTEMQMEWSSNVHAFIQYYQAKIWEQMMDQQQGQMAELIQKVDNLDDGVIS